LTGSSRGPAGSTVPRTRLWQESGSAFQRYEVQIEQVWHQPELMARPSGSMAAQGVQGHVSMGPAAGVPQGPRSPHLPRERPQQQIESRRRSPVDLPLDPSSICTMERLRLPQVPGHQSPQDDGNSSVVTAAAEYDIACRGELLHRRLSQVQRCEQIGASDDADAEPAVSLGLPKPHWSSTWPTPHVQVPGTSPSQFRAAPAAAAAATAAEAHLSSHMESIPSPLMHGLAECTKADLYDLKASAAMTASASSNRLSPTVEAFPGETSSMQESEQWIEVGGTGVAVATSAGTGRAEMDLEALHVDMRCKPCVFSHRGICVMSDCKYCHLVHDREHIRQVRLSKSTRRQLVERSRGRQNFSHVDGDDR